MRMITTLFLLVFINAQISAQSAKRINKKLSSWNKGEVVFYSGDTLACEFSYNPIASEGLVEVKQDEKISVYGPKHVKSFNYYDNKSKLTRTFMTFSLMDTVKLFTRQYFLEVIHLNKFISVFRKKDFGIYPNGRVVTSYERILADMRTSNLHEMTKNEILNLTKDRKEEIKNFISKNKLRLKKTSSYVKVIEYYSGLKSSTK